MLLVFGVIAFKCLGRPFFAGQVVDIDFSVRQELSGPFHMEATPSEKVKVVVRHTHTAPKITVSNWGCLVGTPIHTDGQEKLDTTVNLPEGSDVTTERLTEDGPLSRVMTLVHVPVHSETESHEVHLQVTYQAILKKRTLMPGAPPEPVHDLSLTLRKAYCSEDKLNDFRTKQVADWMALDHLTRLTNESELQFGYRVFLSISKRIQYKPANGFELASSVCKVGTASGGGVSVLFSSVMRANGIPARSLWGKIIPPSETTKEIPSIYNVRAEFFAKGIGWIPVDLPNAIGKEDPSSWFGADDGSFLVMHFEPFFFGNITYALQNIQCFLGQQTGSWKGEQVIETQQAVVTNID